MICLKKNHNNKTNIENIKLREIFKEEVKIKVFYSGICKTDIFVYKNIIKNNNVILGHEGSGVIIESKSELFKPGDHVLWNPYLGDNFLGVNQDGCFSEEIILLDSYVHHHSLYHHIAAYIEPCAAILSPLEYITNKNQSILILGNNRISKLAYLLFNKLGFSVYSQDESNGLLNFDFVIETNSKDSNINLGIDKVKKNGTIFLKSRSNEPKNINIYDIVYKEIKLQGSLFYNFDKTIEIIENNDIKLDNLIGDFYNIENWKLAFEKGFDGDKKIMFRF